MVMKVTLHFCTVGIAKEPKAAFIKLKENNMQISTQNTEIKTEEQAYAFLTEVIKVVGGGFHPDTPFEDYINMKNGDPTFENYADCENLNDRLDECFDIYMVEDRLYEAVDTILKETGNWPKGMGEDTSDFCDDFVMVEPTKRQKAIVYMQQYAQSWPNQIVDQDWLYQISIGEHTPTLDSLIVLLGSVEAIREHLGTELRFVIGNIKS